MKRFYLLVISSKRPPADDIDTRLELAVEIVVVLLAFVAGFAVGRFL